MAITPLPTPPQRSDPANFPARGDAFMTALPTFATEANTLAADVSTKQGLAAASQTAAATSETNAAASAAAAAASSNATIWVTGTTYAVGDVRFSPTDFQSYRRKTNGAGSTDPSLDSTNWQRQGIVAFPLIHVREEQASGTAGGSSVSGTQVRVLNTTVFNSISGASLSSNLVTLPAGTYDMEISAPCGGASGQLRKASLFNNTDSTTIGIGTSELVSSGTSGSQNRSFISGRFTITATKVFKVNHYTATSFGVSGLGAAVSAGINEVYTEAKFWKVS